MTHTARPYQSEAIAAVEAEFASGVRSTVLVLPTGAGKSFTAAEIVKRRQGRVLWIAHRDELIEQGAKALERATGGVPLIEQGEYHASPHLRPRSIVCATIQTISKKQRLEEYHRDDFDLVVYDEAHHSPSETGRRVLSYFETAKILGLTATPDRLDRLALGKVFESVAYVYEIQDAIRDGYLCRVRAQVVSTSMDLSAVGIVANDLNQGDLEAEMTRTPVLHEVAVAVLDRCGDRRTMVFTTGVAQAHAQARVLCDHKPGVAMALDGTVEKDERRRVLTAWRKGDFQILVNVMLFTEGFDEPSLACIAMARPTSSRALFAQMIGRGLRTFPGKDDLLVIDFTGNAGKHDLVNVEDILGGKEPTEVKKRARELSDADPSKTVDEAIAEAKAELDAAEKRRRQKLAQQLRGAVRHTAYDVDVFGFAGLDGKAMARKAEEFGIAPATEKQMALFAKWKIPVPTDIDRQSATRLIGRLIERREAKLCSYGQAKVLGKNNLPTDVSFTVAGAALDYLASKRWRLTTDEHHHIVETMRQMDADRECGGREDAA